MGLEIYYKLSASNKLDSASVRELAQRTAVYAKKIGCVAASDVTPADGNVKRAPLFVSVGKVEETGIFGHIPPKRGWLIEVDPGEGSETATFGLCQYPRRAPFRDGTVPTGYRGGWLLKGSCKTQYAAEHGWEHFLACHKRIISVLDFWRELGVKVEVTDEGGYWETRSETKLRSALLSYDKLIAFLAGAMKDAIDHSGQPFRVESPIFARRDFERLEAAGLKGVARRREK
jgi:hypothetical protein